MALPLSLGDSQEGTYAALVRSNPPPVWSATGGVVPMSSGRVKIAFLRHPVANEEITTFLRGEQLSRIIADRFPDVYDVTYTDDASSLRDHVVIVVKQALQRLEPAEIESLGRRNIAVVNAWDDQIPDQARIEAGDVQMVFSLSQLTQMRREHPGRSVHFVTQHVNLQFPTGTPPDDRLRIGYFGADYNTRIPPPVSSVVDVVDTRADVSLWSPQLLRHNCHWIIRRSQEWDGGKPFMKGFVAARYGAPVIVSPLQDDAMYYLGDDYPYYAPGSAVEMELLLAEMAAGFGGPEWLRAQEIMRQVAARSSLSHVCADFKRMVDDIVG